MPASLLTIAGAILAALAIWATGGDGHTTLATGPTPPADCFVADEPMAGGPAAPSDLAATSVFESVFLANFELTWDDNSDDETCFVVEARFEAAPPPVAYEVIAFIPPNTTNHSDGPYTQGDVVTYRLYAANAAARSEYSQSLTIGLPGIDPTPSPPPPTPTPTPSSAPTRTPEETGSPSPAPSPTASPTPAQLPKGGGASP